MLVTFRATTRTAHWPKIFNYWLHPARVMHSAGTCRMCTIPQTLSHAYMKGAGHKIFCFQNRYMIGLIQICIHSMPVVLLLSKSSYIFFIFNSHALTLKGHFTVDVLSDSGKNFVDYLCKCKQRRRLTRNCHYYSNQSMNIWFGNHN